MSALGHKQTFAVHQPMSALPQKRTWRRLFNHLVGAGEQAGGRCNAKLRCSAI